MLQADLSPPPHAAGRAAGQAPAEAVPGPGLFAMLRSLLAELPGLVSDRVHLFSLELGRATQAMAQIIALGLASAVCVSTAWFGLWACLAFAMIDAGVHWGWVTLILVVCNLGLALGALLRIRALARLLKLPATVRHLTLAPISREPATDGSGAVAGKTEQGA